MNKRRKSILILSLSLNDKSRWLSFEIHFCALIVFAQVFDYVPDLNFLMCVG